MVPPNVRSQIEALTTDIAHHLANADLVDSEEEFSTCWLGAAVGFKIAEITEAPDRDVMLQRLEAALLVDEGLLRGAIDAADTDTERWCATAAYRPHHKLRSRLSIWMLRHCQPPR